MIGSMWLQSFESSNAVIVECLRSSLGKIKLRVVLSHTLPLCLQFFATSLHNKLGLPESAQLKKSEVWHYHSSRKLCDRDEKEEEKRSSLLQDLNPLPLDHEANSAFFLLTSHLQKNP